MRSSLGSNEEVSENLGQGLLTRICDPLKCTICVWATCTFFLGRVSIVSITFSSGSTKYSLDRLHAEPNQAWGSVLGTAVLTP